MKLIKTSIFSMLLIFFVNCTEDESPLVNSDNKEDPQPKEDPLEPESAVYFTYSSYAVNGTDNWIIIHDTDGNLMDYRKVENGGPIEFMKVTDSIPEKITITQVYYDKDSGDNQSHNLLTFTEIATGSNWNTVLQFPQGTNIGKFNVSVENIPGIKGSTLSTERGALNAGDSNTEGNFSNAKLNLLDIPLYQNENYILSIYDNNGGHKYLSIPTPADTSSFTVDYSELLEYDEYLEVDLPDYDFALLFTYGYNEDNPNFLLAGQAFSNNLDFSSSGLFRAGYLDNYENYRTDFSITLGDFFYGFSTSERLDEISIPSRPLFTLENSSVYDLKFSTDLLPLTKNTRHRYIFVDENGVQTSTRWVVQSTGSDNHTIGQLPEEIIIEYPNFNLENLKLEVVNLVTKGFTQEETFKNSINNERRGSYFIENYGFKDFE